MKFIDFILGRDTEITPDFLVGVKDGKTVKVIPSYLKYVALVTQGGTDAPTVNILENTIGNVTISYNSVGYYTFTKTNAFTIGKTYLYVGAIQGNVSNVNGFTEFLGNLSVDSVQLNCSNSSFVPANDQLNQTPIEIRVYP